MDDSGTSGAEAHPGTAAAHRREVPSPRLREEGFLSLRWPGMFEALVRLSIKLAQRVSADKLADRAGRIIAQDARHVTAEMIGAVVPFAVRAVSKEQVVHRPTVSAMPKCVNEVLAVRHENHMIVRPTEIQVGRWVPYLIEFDTHLLIGERSLRKPSESCVLPVLPCALEFVLHRSPPANQERKNEQRHRSDNYNFAAYPASTHTAIWPQRSG